MTAVGRWRRGLAVFAGSVVGTALRAALGLIPDGVGAWPWGTLVANLTGAFLLGYLLARVQGREPRPTLLLAFLGTGLLGSYTTFSAFAFESRMLLAASGEVAGLGYVGASIVLGVFFAFGGIRVARARP